MKYLKKASKSPASGEDDARRIVQDMLAEIETIGEQKVCEYAEKLDQWTGDIIVSADEIKAAGESLSQRARDDIQFAYERVERFAKAQLESMTEFETELSPGLIAGQRLIPVQTAGCYIPGRAVCAHCLCGNERDDSKGCRSQAHVIACSPTRGDAGVHPSILYTADLAGADTILALGGVQGVAGAGLWPFLRTPGRHTGRPWKPLCR